MFDIWDSVPGHCSHRSTDQTRSSLFTPQAGPFCISSQSTSWQLSMKSENYEENSQLSEHALSGTISQWCGAVCWHINWCLCMLWPPKFGGQRILLDNINFDTVLILIRTLYSTCIWLFLSGFHQLYPCHSTCQCQHSHSCTTHLMWCMVHHIDHLCQ